MGLNKVLLLGHLGADPELRFTPTQNPVCNLNVATGEKRKNQDGEWVDHTEWHRVVVWGKQAENCANYLAKGRQVFVEGRIQTRKWQDQEGNTRYATDIVANNVQFISAGKQDAASAGPSMDEDYGQDSSQLSPQPTSTPVGRKPVKQSEPISLDDDDIPF